MLETGFFSRKNLKDVSKARGGQLVSQHTLDNVSPASVAQMNPTARTKNMPASGSAKPLIYVLGDCPDEVDDKQGKQFCGDAGRLLKKAFPGNWQSSVRFNYVVQTRPPQNRPPTELEVEAFRKTVAADIGSTKPKIILGCGPIVLRWALGKITNAANITTCQGRFFPIELAGHKCWFVPIYHPKAFVSAFGTSDVDWSRAQYIKIKDQKLKWMKTLAPIWKKQVDTVFKRCEKIKPPTTLTEEEVKKDVVGYRSIRNEYQALKDRVNLTLSCKVFAFDLETSKLRPYHKDSRIASVGIADKFGAYAFTLNHLHEDWGEHQRDVQILFKKLCYANCKKIVHNLNFDLEWVMKRYGYDVAFAGEWVCTQAQAYVVRNVSGGLSLNFLSLLYFGLKIKGITHVDRGRVEDADIDELLVYNAIDCKILLPLYEEQNEALDKMKLQDVNRLQQERIIPAISAQLKGFPIDQTVVKEVHGIISDQVKEAREYLMSMKSVKRFEKKFGAFNPASDPNLKTIFTKILGFEDVKSTDEEHLKTNLKCKFSESLLKWKKPNKALGTYILPFLRGSETCKVWDDDYVHAQIKTTNMDTPRVSITDPNLQNQPKRNPEIKKLVRRQFRAPDGYVIIEIDFGQLEYRGIGMATNDKVIVDSCFSGYDVHMDWAKRLAKAYKPKFQRYLDKYGDEKAAYKAWRTDVKTQWVFSGFYGAHVSSREKYMEVPAGCMADQDKEFWKMFAGVKTYQEEKNREYDTKGYVSQINGRRRWGPINYNQLINSGIQGFCGDIVSDRWTAIVEEAIRTDDLDMIPLIQIHDAMVSIVPEKKAMKYIERQSEIMLSCPFKAINVPLIVEASIGKSWEEMKEVIVYDSYQLGLWKPEKPWKAA